MSANIIRNGDFEENGGSLTSWEYSASGSGVTGETEEITNNYCSVIATQSVYQNVALVSGESYNLDLSSKGETSGTVSIMLVNSSTVYWSAPFNSGRSVDWKKESFSFVADATWTPPFMLHFQAAYSQNQDDTVDIDNVYLSEA